MLHSQKVSYHLDTYLKDRQQSMRGQFAVLPLKWPCYLAVNSINLHDIYLNNQLGTINIDVNIIKKDRRKDM